MSSANAGPAVCRTIDDAASFPHLTDRAREIVRSAPADKVAGLPALLLEKGHATDAMRLIPALLPMRPAVWWGCLCTWHSSGGRAPQGLEELALGAAVHWVYHPTIGKAKAMGRAWRAVGLRSPSGCCARAAELAGWLEPDSNIFHVSNATAAAKVLFGAAQLAYLRARQRGIACSEEQFVRFGIDVAENKTPWDS